MQIIAQSHTPTKTSYIHLAYISAQLGKSISEGELLSMQTILGAALATAVACGALGAKLGPKGKRWRMVKIGAVLGFIAFLSGS